MIATDYFPCDDARAAELERDGWTIRRNANLSCHHGYYAPHMAVREVEENTFRPIGDIAAQVIAGVEEKMRKGR
ncbi:MAG: hypothetical protein RBR34_05685 [Rhodospirillaceae bacterium]|nr:hypothetical protein [Rhodospirillaceae bacterium]